jgi:rRNA maturation endonuclease Nob1
MSDTLSTCDWQENDIGWWDTACNNTYVFIKDGPIYNDFKFCPYCGKSITEIPYDEHTT